MKTSTDVLPTLLLLLLPALATAQTPAGFEPAVSQKLEVTFGAKAVTEPGTALTKTDTARQPTIGLAAGTAANGTYLWMMIDLDASTNFINPGAGQPATYLHTVIRDFKASTSSELSTTATGPVSWFGPAPPAENPPHPHRYTNLLWEQPGGLSWQVPAAANTMLQSGKVGFDVPKFITAAGLAAPVAANYFNVTG
ncbi:PEBP-like protein [Xylariomycetidae sp. FL2044]|nr:PEBP-like protein [Xylariomycetidae sp. FL2044]